MKRTELIMGMPITVEVVDNIPMKKILEVFDFFRRVDERYSTYKPDSEISQINAGLPEPKWSREMTQVLGLCEQTKRQTHGYFDIKTPAGKLDPSGLVKGWSIREAAGLLKNIGAENFYIEAGGDIQVAGKNSEGRPWSVGIRSPFDVDEIVKTIDVEHQGVATSGTYVRGQHIYNPHNLGQVPASIKSLTVIGPDIYEADRYATAAFAMGSSGINFIEKLPGFEAYMIDDKRTATLTSGFERFVRA